MKLTFSKNRNSGFSFIELSLALIVVGAISMIAIERYTSGKKNEMKLQALNDLEKIRSAIEAYAVANNSYPCPASPMAQESDPQFAVGMRTADTVGNCIVDSNYGIFSARFEPDPARFESPVDYSTSGHGVSFDEDIIIGAVPCKDIGLPANCGFDPFGNRYAYTVIPELARISACRNYVMVEADRTKDQSSRGIKMLTDADINKSLEDNYLAFGRSPDPDYAVIYYGADGFGAFPNYGGASVQRISPTLANGVYIGDNVFQEINHDLRTAFDEYFFAPDKPLSAEYTFGDILVYGRVSELDNKYCVSCDDVCGLGTGGVVTIDNFTACDAGVKTMCTGS